MKGPTARLLTVCMFLGLACLTGLAAIFLIKTGTTFLENQHEQAEGTPMLSRHNLLGGLSEGGKGQANGGSSSKALGRDDLAVAVLTDLGHEDYVNFSRVWRQGVKTYVATNHTLDDSSKRAMWGQHNESWGFYPDDRPLHTLALKGDSRAALAPFLAYREFGETFKWLMYGDDDTFFFLDAVLEVVKDLDPDMPYFLTDHMWWTEKWHDEAGNPHEHTKHPNWATPQCVPCNYNKSTSSQPFPFPKGCPCTPITICDADNKGIFFRGRNGQCGMPRVPIRTYSMHGGAGGIISVGLLRKISLEDFEDCVTSTYTTGGDAVISICLWQAGYYMTVPDPLWHPQGLHMFDVGPQAQEDHEEIVGRVARLMGNLLQATAGGCTEDPCKLELQHFVTLHMRSRKFPSRAAHAETSRLLAALADFVYGRSETLAPEGGADKEDTDRRVIDGQVLAALEEFREQQLCQESKQGATRSMRPGRAHSCAKSKHGVRAGPQDKESRKNRFLPLLQAAVDEAAWELAAAIVKDVFDRYPSPTGTYGEIPVGRE